MNTIKCARYKKSLKHNFSFLPGMPGTIEIVRVVSGKHAGKNALIAWGWRAADHGIAAKGSCVIDLVAGEQDIIEFSF